MPIAYLVHLYRYSLQPLDPLAFFGLQVNALDVIAAFRLCLAMRQIREEQHRLHLAKKDRRPVEDISFVRSLTATLLVVYGGEAITGS